MNILVYGEDSDKELLVRQIKRELNMKFTSFSCSNSNKYDAFIELLRKEKFDVVFITMDNAEGMEGVIATKKLHPEMPVIWFSNDKGFGPQSYRLGVKYFAIKPVNEHILKVAIERCEGLEKIAYE